jgi:hypothetical protein
MANFLVKKSIASGASTGGREPARNKPGRPVDFEDVVELAPAADSIHNALADVTTTKRLVADFVHKRGTGRARALMRLRKLFAGAEFVGPAGDCFEIAIGHFS